MIGTFEPHNYALNSDLVRVLTSTQGGTQRLKVERTFDQLNRLESYRASPSNEQPWGRTNLYNLAGQLQQSRSPDGVYWKYAYNEQAEVTSGSKYETANTLLAGYDFDYSYDPSGNRLTSHWAAQSYTYNLNPLNQYNYRHSPAAYVQVVGQSSLGATLSDNGVSVPVTKQGSSFYGVHNRGYLSAMP